MIQDVAGGGHSVLAGRMPTPTAAPDGCVFCAIAGGRAEATCVYEDEDLVAFMDLAPVTPGHLLVVPRRHAVGPADLPEDLGMAMFRLSQRVSTALRRSELRCEGTNLFLADGDGWSGGLSRASARLPTLRRRRLPHRCRLADSRPRRAGDHLAGRPVGT